MSTRFGLTAFAESGSKQDSKRMPGSTSVHAFYAKPLTTSARARNASQRHRGSAIATREQVSASASSRNRITRTSDDVRQFAVPPSCGTIARGNDVGSVTHWGGRPIQRKRPRDYLTSCLKERGQRRHGPFGYMLEQRTIFKLLHRIWLCPLKVLHKNAGHFCAEVVVINGDVELFINLS